MKKIYTIGRDEDCDIVIPDNTDVISRLHATIRIESNDKIYLIDQSRNGTYVNGMKMSSNVEIPVSRKDVISFAHIYNLDWTLIPKQKVNILKISLIILACITVITGIALAVISNMKEKENEVQPDNTTTTFVQEDSIETVENDSINKEPAIVENEKPQIKEVKQETRKAEEPKEEEEVYNPIY